MLVKLPSNEPDTVEFLITGTRAETDQLLADLQECEPSEPPAFEGLRLEISRRETEHRETVYRRRCWYGVGLIAVGLWAGNMHRVASHWEPHTRCVMCDWVIPNAESAVMQDGRPYCSTHCAQRR